MCELVNERNKRVMKLSVLSWLEKTSVLYSDKIMFKDEKNIKRREAYA
jgi:hypothetical protein